MADFYDSLNEKLRAFIDRQAMFFVATAPATGGRVNVSPKGQDSLRILDDRRIMYLDHTGSGNETAAHLLDNGRITLMFCSFDRNPMILRIYGTGRSVQPADEEWPDLMAHFSPSDSARQIFVINIDSIQTSCGYSVPLYDFVGQRDTLSRWAEKKGADGLKTYRREKNVESIDGLPTGLRPDEPVNQ